MKFRIEDDWEYDDLVEDFRTQKDKDVHAKKHGKDTLDYYGWNADEYEQAANKLALTPVDHKRILGYVSGLVKDDLRYCKWDKETELFVCYKPNGNNPIIISAYHKYYRDFNKDYWDDYVDEIKDEN